MQLDLVISTPDESEPHVDSGLMPGISATGAACPFSIKTAANAPADELRLSQAIRSGMADDIAAHVPPEQRSERSWELFATIFANSPIPIIISRLSDGRYLEANAAALKMMRYTRGQVIGRNAIELNIWPRYADRENIVATLRAEGRIDRLDISMRRQDGAMVNALYSAQLVTLAGQICIISTILDVTDKKHAEEQQRQLEDRFLKVFRHSPYAIVLSRLQTGEYIDVNEAWSGLTGYKANEVVGQRTLSVGVWANPAERQQMVDILERDGAVTNFPFQLRRKGGAVVEALLSGALIELNGEKCLLAMSVDVTERNRADAQLRLSEQRFADVLDAAGEFVWEVDANDRFAFVSPRVVAITGFTPEEMIGRTPVSFMPAEEAERVRTWLKTNRDDGTPIRSLEHLSLCKDGRVVWLQISAVPIHDCDGKVIGMRGTGLDITERKNAAKLIEELATLDALTHLPNRRLLMDRLGQSLFTAQRNREMIGVLFIDLDRFKTINDSLGHAIGDGMLKEVAKRLSSLTRRGDTLARLGGDEFVMVLGEMHSADDAGTVAKKVIAALAAPYEIDGQVLSNGASIGISVFPNDATDGPTLIRNADMAMYVAKNNGRHNYQFFAPEMNVRAMEKLAMENSLRDAVAKGQFELHYHPKFNLADGRLCGVEALVRWHHPQLGTILPDRFIPVAEENGLIVALGEWVLGEACRQSRAWADAYGKPLPIAVNLSTSQMTAELPRVVRNALIEARLDPHLLELEITESLLMRNIDESMTMLRQLSDLGVSIAIDDFGTGYSSLAYLRRFHVDTVKIAQSFIGDVAGDMDDAAIVEAIVALAHSLKLRVVAVGVETRAQHSRLAELHCDQCQGFLFSRPLSAKDFEASYLQEAVLQD